MVTPGFSEWFSGGELVSVITQPNPHETQEHLDARHAADVLEYMEFFPED